jgi:hypothetical protein
MAALRELLAARPIDLFLANDEKIGSILHSREANRLG